MFLHHSQTYHLIHLYLPKFEYYTFLHHSQTVCHTLSVIDCLNTIRFYIILKRSAEDTQKIIGLNTIRFYIILKLAMYQEQRKIV